MLKHSLIATLLAFSLPALAAENGPGRGAYLATAGDCIACHTGDDGQPFAGGHALATPIGTLYATNITPDKTHGIGNYSFADFDAAVRLGRSKAGHALYPAMPFTAYEKISEADMRALYAYFMDEVEPVAKPNRASDIPWPFNMRWPLKIWNALFTEQQRFVARPEQSEQWNRGAYLVQGLGHCGTCHTPRGLNMAEQGLDERSPQFLAGATLGGWYAPDLRGLAALDDDELFDLLSRGQSRNHAFAGPMADVISHSLGRLDEADIRSMMFYLRDLAPVARQLQVAGPRPAEQALAAAARAAALTKPARLLLVTCQCPPRRAALMSDADESVPFRAPRAHCRADAGRDPGPVAAGVAAAGQLP